MIGSGGPLKVEDLREGDVVALTCMRCGAVCQMRVEAVQKVTRPYRLLDAFGIFHVCGVCFGVGASVSLTRDPLYR